MTLDSLLWDAVGGKNVSGDGTTNDSDLKFIFVGGKGGVGKTTSSSAIATLLARRCNKRVLLVSTDPAHSLGDAFRTSFSNQPISPDLPNLHVMEIDPSDSMKAEMEKWAKLADEVSGGTENDLVKNIHSFQEWLSGIPGIDEATALSSAIKHIESGEYDIIVFDTAPTGHTLKLLALPEILSAGIEKLQGWQSTIWGFVETFKSIRPGAAGAASKRKVDAKAEVAARLEEYRRVIQKVAMMLQDELRTRFIVVCIAEYLSISETQRLLQELKRNKVRVSNVIVNQLVIQQALEKDELEELEGLAEVGSLHLAQKLLGKTVHACRLTTARKTIQEKYLKQLKTFPEAQGILDGICEVPLLPEEVTGNAALERFGSLMVACPPDLKTINESGIKSHVVAKPLYDDQLRGIVGQTGDNEEHTENKHAIDLTPTIGDTVSIQGLAKSAMYNGLNGTVISGLDEETGRFGVSVEYEGKKKKLALQLKNLSLEEKAKKQKKSLGEVTPSSANASGSAEGAHNVMTEDNVNKAKGILEDPEIKAIIAQNPRFKDAVEDVTENPMNIMKYLMDPEMSPLISKAMEKLKSP
uniref:STI1 domain-containing protein n=1 Tax=Odontella aurita TaxID=265563 RepID=A0A7S4HKC3_9STRA|mmetsp:Transcript_11351/g.33430  ORF Transcript_11351/g.33430 Transcript_11351/m.33430 type:complete len:583 (+) Transcript_11351:127-1875(+)|eukprot:CAMPEP_0113531794 /NCGR_PEP_ID=MMETSP0015_2-20120614/3693_1 /TAXON_ID=2838 /ORGANISM="Odontella" /LENGTH=582 /DNA_ID=CAMNT_0000430667 /DNA_START=74 /DNA_END=1822 /DNA_ORIENTATION=- /assembly_acc=CAM_ASM_000160